MFVKNQLISLLCLLCIFTFNACTKDESTTETATLNINLNSIYEISNVKIAVFEGWVDAGLQDLDEGTKRFYAVHRSNNANESLKLEPNPYTVVLYYEDFGAIYVEKIDLKATGETVSFIYNKQLELRINVDKLVYLQNETINFSYSSISPLGGVKVTAFVNETEVEPMENRKNYAYKLIKDGINNIELKLTYISGHSASYKYKVVVVPQRNIENIWKNLDEEYLRQEIFNNMSLVALENDTMIQGNLIKANTIIDGLYGVYKFRFDKGVVNEIEVNHGDINMDPNFNFEPIKQRLETLYGSSVENSYRNYSFSSGDYVINLSMDSKTNVVSKISRQ